MTRLKRARGAGHDGWPGDGSPTSDLDAGSEVLSIGEACEMLGLSRGTVQKMVDGGELTATRTHGGHRRILRRSLQAYLADRSVIPRKPELLVLVAEDNAIVRQQYERHMKRTTLPVRIAFAADAIEALLAIERQRPDVVVADLCMRPFDGFHLVSKLRTSAEFSGIGVVVVTALTSSEIHARGGLPPSVPVFEKPDPWEGLGAFLHAQIQLRFGAAMDRQWYGVAQTQGAPTDE